MTTTDRVLAQDELRALSLRSNWPGIIRLSIHVALLALAGWWVAMAEGWVLLPAMLALALVQAALFAPSHETMHQTVFTSAKANAIVGWITFLPALQSSHFYAAFHYIHHRHTNVPGQDPELMLPEPQTLGQYALRILGAGYFGARLTMIIDAWRGDMAGPKYFFINDRQRPGVIRNGLTNTRTTLTNRLVRLLMWDMPFHAEHHLYPSIPFHRLADAHALLREKLRFVQPGYARWNAGFVRELKGKR